MKIDMTKATVEWLEAWLAKQNSKVMRAHYANLQITVFEAQKQYLFDKLSMYLDAFQVRENDLTIYVHGLSKEDLRQLYNLKVGLVGGIAVLDYIDIDTYYEPYCDEPSNRLEITFRVPKEGAR